MLNDQGFELFGPLIDVGQAEIVRKTLFQLGSAGARCLLNREKAKGALLTKDEVEAIRDKAVCIAMRASAKKRMDESRGYDDIDPGFAWQQWQQVRTQLGHRTVVEPRSTMSIDHPPPWARLRLLTFDV